MLDNYRQLRDAIQERKAMTYTYIGWPVKVLRMGQTIAIVQFEDGKTCSVWVAGLKVSK